MKCQNNQAKESRQGRTQATTFIYIRICTGRSSATTTTTWVNLFETASGHQFSRDTDTECQIVEHVCRYAACMTVGGARLAGCKPVSVKAVLLSNQANSKPERAPQDFPGEPSEPVQVLSNPGVNGTNPN